MVHTMLRGLWFIVIGWWLAAIWVIGALTFCVTIIFAPVGMTMLAKTSTVALLPPDPEKVEVVNG